MPPAYVYAREREELLRQRRALTGEKTQNAMRKLQDSHRDRGQRPAYCRQPIVGPTHRKRPSVQPSRE